MADKAGLEMIGALLFAATLFVIVAGGFAVRHQLAIDQPQAGAQFTAIEAGLNPVRVSRTHLIINRS